MLFFFFSIDKTKKGKLERKKIPTTNTLKVYLKTPETTTWGETINTISSDYILLIKIIKSDLFQSSQILKKEVSKYTLFSFFFAFHQHIHHFLFCSSICHHSEVQQLQMVLHWVTYLPINPILEIF